MAQKTFNTDNIRETAQKFSNQATAFEDSMRQLTSTIENYIAENRNEAGSSVQAEWVNARQNMDKVKQYLDKFGEGLKAQAQKLDDTEEILKWK